jgi:hypothetical protein
MNDMMIVGYRPRPAHEDRFLALLKDHVPFLRRLGLATERPWLAIRSKSGEVIEIFEWQPGGLQKAHANAEVTALWGEFSAVCDFVPLRELPETQELFAQFSLLEL